MTSAAAMLPFVITPGKYADRGLVDVRITKIEVHQRPYPKRGYERRSYNKPPRAYVWVDSKEAKRDGAPVNDILTGRRYNRPEQRLQPLVQEIVRTYLPEATVRWSQKAGCSCPCSPGFVISVPKDQYGWKQFGKLSESDLSITIKATEVLK